MLRGETVLSVALSSSHAESRGGARTQPPNAMRRDQHSTSRHLLPGGKCCVM